MQAFVPAAASVPGVVRVEATSSGPSVHFIVTTDRPWSEVIADVEAKLFARGHAGDLPPFDYDVRETEGRVAGSEPGYIQVFPA